MCIDFSNLNKTCPKDTFSLPHIDMLVDAIAGHKVLMHPNDQEKIVFITERGIFYCKVMPFGPKNTSTTI